MADIRVKCATLVSFITILTCYPAVDATVNSKINRVIDLSSQLVKIVERINIEDLSGPYVIEIDPSHRERLAYIEATVAGQKSVELTKKPDGSYEADLTGMNTKEPLVVTSVYTKLLQPYPAEISQNERQLVRYQGLLTTLSPYLTNTITTKIKLPQQSRLESFTRASKMITDSNKLTYGPFRDVKPNQVDPLTIHYENNTPFVTVKHLSRTVEVSPWGQSINIINEVAVLHTGAKLKGPFSRFDYQRDHSNGLNSVRNFIVELPKTTKDIYFRDGIGNISTSNVRITNSKTLLGLKPRFPLFGGWATDFNLGYRIPISEFVRDAGSSQVLSLPFADVLYENMFVEEATVRVVLPSGATNIEVSGSISFERLIDDLSYSYLDIIGRPVVVLKKSNIVTQHLEGKPIIIRYDYNKIFMLQEPILLLVVAIGTFILMAIYSKMTTRTSVPTSVDKLKPE